MYFARARARKHAFLVLWGGVAEKKAVLLVEIKMQKTT